MTQGRDRSGGGGTVMGGSKRHSKPTSGERQDVQRKDVTPFRGLWLFWENQPCFGYVKRWHVERGICKEG